MEFYLEGTDPTKTIYSMGEKASFAKQLSQELTLPDYCPDIARIIDSNASIFVTDCNIKGGIVKIAGDVSYNILYLCDKDRLLHKFNFDQEFTIEHEIGGGEEVIFAGLSVYAKEPVMKLSGSRKLSVKLDCDFEISRAEKCAQICLEQQDAIETRIKEETVLNFNYVRGKTVKVSEDATIPESFVSINEILCCNSSVGTVNSKIENDLVILSADAELAFVYCGEDDECHSYKLNVPITQIVECPDISEGSKIDGELTVSAVKCGIGIDSMGRNRVISVDFYVSAQVRTYENMTVQYVCDAYSTAFPCELERQTARFAKFEKLSVATAEVSETIGNENGEVEKILSTRAKARILRKRYEGGKVYIQGSCDAVIFAKTTLGGFAAFEYAMPFEYTAELQDGVNDAQIRADVIKISCERNGDEYDIYAKLEIRATSLLNGSLDEVVKISVLPDDGVCEKSALTIYYPEKSESLWEIAKAHRVSIEKIKEANGMESDQLSDIKYILIPR